MQNQLSKHNLKLWCYGIPSNNCKTTFAAEQSVLFAKSFPAYKKKSNIILLWPAETNNLNPHFLGSFGLYWQILLCFVFAGIIMFIYWVNWFWFYGHAIFLTAAITGRILKTLSLLFLGLSFAVMSTTWAYFRSCSIYLLDITWTILG